MPEITQSAANPILPIDPSLPYRLVQEELFDLTLYQELQRHTHNDLQRMLSELIVVERQHVVFWQQFFKREADTLHIGNRIKLRLMVWLCRIFGPVAVQLVLEAIEINGIRKYLVLWRG